jgi:phosphomannomutase
VLLHFSSLQIRPPHDKNIQDCIMESLDLDRTKDVFNYKIKTRDEDVRDPLDEMSEEYFKILKASSSEFPLAKSVSGMPKIVYSAMHGVGADFIDQAFRLAGFPPVIHVRTQRGKRLGFSWICFSWGFKSPNQFNRVC